MACKHLEHNRINITSEMVDLLAKNLPEIQVVNKAEFIKGMGIEQEHSDIVGQDTIKLAKIALAHLREIPDYYTRLIKMEEEAKEQLKRRA